MAIFVFFLLIDIKYVINSIFPFFTIKDFFDHSFKSNDGNNDVRREPCESVEARSK